MDGEFERSPKKRVENFDNGVLVGLRVGVELDDDGLEKWFEGISHSKLSLLRSLLFSSSMYVRIGLAFGLDEVEKRADGLVFPTGVL